MFLSPLRVNSWGKIKPDFYLIFYFFKNEENVKNKNVNCSTQTAVTYHFLCVLQRTGTRRRYQDDGISDDEIEGKRTFDLDEKLQCARFNSDLIKHMEGKGECFSQLVKRNAKISFSCFFLISSIFVKSF